MRMNRTGRALRRPGPRRPAARPPDAGAGPAQPRELVEDDDDRQGHRQGGREQSAAPQPSRPGRRRRTGAAPGSDELSGFHRETRSARTVGSASRAPVKNSCGSLVRSANSVTSRDLPACRRPRTLSSLTLAIAGHRASKMPAEPACMSRLTAGEAAAPMPWQAMVTFKVTNIQSY